MKVIDTIQAYDISIFMWVSNRKTKRFLVSCARLISKTGDGPLYLLLMAYLFWSGVKYDIDMLTCLLLAFLLERPVYTAVKNICRRDRPPVTLNIPGFVTPSDRFSFPSGHTSAAFLVATTITMFYPQYGLIPLTWATLMGISRVILGVHFPTDTLIGAAMGSVIALASMECVLP
jgi:undecaprenyl-diphosphatase